MKETLENMKAEVKKFISEKKLFEESKNLSQIYNETSEYTYNYLCDRFKSVREKIDLSEVIYGMLIEKYKNSEISFNRLLELITSEEGDEYLGYMPGPLQLAKNAYVLLTNDVITVQELFSHEDAFSDRKLVKTLIENKMLDQTTLENVLKNIESSSQAKAILLNKRFFHKETSVSLLNVSAIASLLKKIDATTFSDVEFFDELYELNKETLKFMLKNKLFDDVLIDDENTHKILDHLRHPETHTVEVFSYQVEPNGLYDDGWREHKTERRKEEDDTDYEFLELLDYSEKWLKVCSFQQLTLAEKEQLLEELYKLHEIQQLENELIEKKKQVEKDAMRKENILKQIVGTHLEDQYDFEQLKNILTKDNEKKRIKLNC